jgi:hypothetical protein
MVMEENKMSNNVVKNMDMSKFITEWFTNLIKEGLQPGEALEYLDYQIFVRDSNWFHSLSDEKQTEIRNVLHSIRLVHK